MSRSALAPPASNRARIAARDRRSGRRLPMFLTLALAASGWSPAWTSHPANETGISPAAAKRCADKLERLQRFAVEGEEGKRQVTRFTQEEVNSYLALEVSPKYHASLKRVTFAFEESRLRCTADIDFDRLRLESTQSASQLLAWMFSGIHRLALYGILRSEGGRARFQLLEARFDGTSLPNLLVEEILSAVGRKQEPPFDPMQSSQMPYGIRKVELHAGWILVYQ